MNRRINRYIIDPAHESRGWRLASSVAVFLFALAVAALLSIDDVEGPRRPAVEVEP